MKRNTKLWKARKRTIARSPNYLRAVQINKPVRAAVRGTFGAASDCISIDPATGQPREAQ